MALRPFRFAARSLAVLATSACSLVFDTSGFEGTRTTPRDGGLEAAASARYRDEVLSDRPIAYFRLGERSSPFASEVGNARGDAVGSPAFAVPGALGPEDDGAFGVQGRGGIDLGTAFDVIGTRPFAFEAWVSFELVDTSYRPVFFKSTGAGADRDATVAFLVDANEGRVLSLQRVVGGEPNTASIPAPSTGGYHHVVFEHDGNVLRLFTDGVERASAADARPSRARAGVVYVGTPDSVEPTLQPLMGNVDEVAIYDRALGAARVAAHYRAASGR